jgi:type III secretory pathway component EscV
VVKKFNIETGTVVIPDMKDDTTELVVQISQAISLKRIADALEALVKQPVVVKRPPTVFEELCDEMFGGGGKSK